MWRSLIPAWGRSAARRLCGQGSGISLGQIMACSHQCSRMPRRTVGRWKYVYLTNASYWLPDVSRTLHGRDIFAPVGAYLAKGVPLADFGPAIKDPVRLAMPKPEKTSTGWRAHVTVVDVFGNCATDLPASELTEHNNATFRLRGRSPRLPSGWSGGI